MNLIATLTILAASSVPAPTPFGDMGEILYWEGCQAVQDGDTHRLEVVMDVAEDSLMDGDLEALMRLLDQCDEREIEL